MSDAYQAIYDATRSRISGGNISDAVEAAMRNANIGECAYMIQQSAQQAISFYESPSAIYRPALSIDGNKWCALYGDNLQDGVAGFGDSPALAMSDFDKQWYSKIKGAA